MTATDAGLRAVVAHCWQGSPTAGWYPSLARELGDSFGINVSVPAMPDSDDPDPGAWQVALEHAIGSDPGPLVLVGHSLGALAVLRWLLAAPAPIAGVAFVAPPIGPSHVEVINRFAVDAHELPAALSKARRAVVAVSEADPYLLPTPAFVAATFAKAGADLLLLPGRGHFSPASGLAPLPEILPFFRELADGPVIRTNPRLPMPASKHGTGTAPA